MSWFVLASIVGCVIGYPLMAEFVARREDIHWTGTGNALSKKDDLLRARLGSARSNLADQNSGTALTSVQSDDRAWKGWRSMEVVTVKDESPDCRSFQFRPMDGGGLPPFLGGQFVSVRVQDPISGKRINRCYSLSSGPSEPCYRISVKRVPGGEVSNLLHDRIKVGDLLDIQMPSGRFHLDLESRTRPLVLIAAGIGITPCLSMLMQSLELSPTRQVHLFFQLRDSSNAPFLGLLRQLRESLAAIESNVGKGLFHLHVWFSQPGLNEVSPSDRTGRINAPALLSQLGTSDGDFRICGPDVFMSSLAAGLVEGGVVEKRVQYESFGGKSKGVGAITVEPPDSSDAKTRHGDAASASHQVRFESSDQTHVWENKDGSLLDFAENQEIATDSSCRSGVCGMCVRSLLEGKVRYSEEPSCEVGDDEVVMCVAHPDSDLRIDV